MKKNEVPQDDEPIYQNKFGDGLLKYATDEQNEYVAVRSAGWEPEIVALKQAWELVEEKVEFARQEVKSGRKSPIFYFMEKKLMDPGILAGYMGLWRWQVNRHFKPGVFDKLKSSTLEKYAKVFDIDIELLAHFDPNHPETPKKA